METLDHQKIVTNLPKNWKSCEIGKSNDGNFHQSGWIGSTESKNIKHLRIKSKQKGLENKNYNIDRCKKKKSIWTKYPAQPRIKFYIPELGKSNGSTKKLEVQKMKKTGLKAQSTRKDSNQSNLYTWVGQAEIKEPIEDERTSIKDDEFILLKN